VKELALAAPPPALEIDSETTAKGGDLVLRGTLELPFYLDSSYTEVNRDPESGSPLARADASETERRVPFVLRIPAGAEPPLPIVLYQHGAPGSPEEINSASEEFLIDAGYALIGIQDLPSRLFGGDRSAQSYEILVRLAFAHRMPRLHFQTEADLLGLLRAVQGMGRGEGLPEIDPSRIYFRGISFGAHHALGFLPFAPEVSAAVAVAGGGRYFENVIHQIDFLGTLAAFEGLIPEARPGALLAGFAALQSEADRDDPALLARHLYREPLAARGQRDVVPPSLLWIEGVGDRVVSNNATRAAAAELGIPRVRKARDNLAPGVTAGHFQYAPESTPSCVDSGQSEAHYCPQSALEAEAQILHFFAGAARGEPEILDPLEDAR
jgi:dienelactone hydrolase